jgi:hypothetical protein
MFVGCAVVAPLNVAWCDDNAILPSVSARVADETLARPADIPADSELESSAARIGKISITIRPVFDTQRSDENTRIFRLANKLHISTQEETVRAQLLFKTGDLYQSRKIAESERLMRQVRYLHDAQILPVAFHDGVVDISVLTQDTWTLTTGLSVGRTGGSNSTSIELQELNVQGRGSELAIKKNSDVDRDTLQFIYHDRQLGHSWWRVLANYSDNSDGRRARFEIEQPFYSLGTRRAGGMAFDDDHRIDSRYDLGKVIDQYDVVHRSGTAYFGISPGLSAGEALRWLGGFTWDESRFATAAATVNSTTLPSDRKLSYPWIGLEWVQDRYRTGRNRDQIARTEDYTTGWQINARLGWNSPAFGADHDAAIFNATLHRGVRNGEKNTWDFTAAVNGRWQGSRVLNTLASGSVTFHHRQSKHFLFYAALSGANGTRLDEDQQLLLGGDNGLRGYPLRYQGGTGRWVATIEQRYYSNWYPFRLFNVGAAAFADAGATTGSNPFGTPSQGVLRDVGIGLRIGNARSALGNVLHIDLGYPLDGAGLKRTPQLTLETRLSY